jgi:Na+(H+)/acetate symporter ActP
MVRGVILLIWAERIVRRVERGRPPPGSVTVARLLGARELVQATVVALCPNRHVRRVSVLVDGLHLSTMVPVAVAGGRWRRLGTAAAIEAGADLVSAVCLARTTARTLTTTWR